MEQMKIPKEMVVSYEASFLPKRARILHPIIFHDGNAFCCLLGPDPESGIFGCGGTKEDAVKDWDHQLRLRIDNFDGSDETTLFAINSLKATGDPEWQKNK